MRVSEFYESGCPDYTFYSSLKRDNYSHIMNTCIYQVCQSLKEGEKTEEILKDAGEFMHKEYAKAFFAFPWQKDAFIQDNLQRLNRFLMWLGKTEILEANVDVMIPLGEDALQSTVNLICRYGNGMLGAINIFPGKADKSLRGKNVHTNINYDLYVLCAKLALEQKYPYIVVTNVYLQSDEDSLGNIQPKFVVNDTMNSNVFSISFKEYYKGGILDTQVLLETIRKVISLPMGTNCYGCPHASLCKVNTISSAIINDVDTTEKPVYQMPTFTPSQLKVVHKEEGPMLVCAGPGSGKTATLVGRICQLLQKGIEPDFLLAITFTREAARELKERVACFASELPYISTIHALCYDILIQNADLLGKKVKLLSQQDKLSLIEGLLEVYPLTGFEYEQYDESEDSYKLLKAVERKLDKFVITFEKNEEAFLKEEHSLNHDFVEFAKNYADLVEKKGYISFKEQISLCVKLFEEHPDVQKLYSSMYKYVMVDEFQDIDEMQARFIYLLASHGNLVVVGDDDQSIYGFRGGDYRFMLEFPKAFPESEVVVLEENFRATKKLVAASQSFIQKNACRINKSIIAGRNDCGSDPVLLESTDSGTVEQLVKSALDRGYSLKDIALLAMKNSTLQNYKRELSVPCVLERNLLIQDPLFGLVKDSLSLYFNKIEEDSYSLYHLCRLYGGDPRTEGSLYAYLLQRGYPDVREGDYSVVKDDAVYTALRFLNHALVQLDNPEITPIFFVQFVAYAGGLENSPSLSSLLSVIADNRLHSMKDFSEFLNCMVRFGDDTKVDVSTADALHLITNHESKGREFPVVLMVDDFSAESSEETRRLFYVAMTRAKEELYVLADNHESLAYKEIKGGVA